MTDRPIIFSGPMVKALLEGRKTMTRRILKPQPNVFEIDGTPAPVTLTQVDGDPWPRIAVGRVITRQEVRFFPGMRLWVRENWKPHSLYSGMKPREMPRSAVFYAADEAYAPSITPWLPSIHMPRWASRLTLIVSVVKIERLRDISEKDAIAEGVELETADPPFYYVPGIYPHSITGVGIEESGPHAARSFSKLWNHLHGVGAWDANPEVVVLNFAVHRSNIDTLKAAA